MRYAADCSCQMTWAMAMACMSAGIIQAINVSSHKHVLKLSCTTTMLKQQTELRGRQSLDAWCRSHLLGVGQLPKASLGAVATGADAVVAAQHSHISGWAESSTGVVPGICCCAEVQLLHHTALIVVQRHLHKAGQLWASGKVLLPPKGDGHAKDKSRRMWRMVSSWTPPGFMTRWQKAWTFSLCGFGWPAAALVPALKPQLYRVALPYTQCMSDSKMSCRLGNRTGQSPG